MAAWPKLLHEMDKNPVKIFRDDPWTPPKASRTIPRKPVTILPGRSVIILPGIICYNLTWIICNIYMHVKNHYV